MIVKGGLIMNFTIVAKYKVESDKAIDKYLKYEYFEKDNRIYHDNVYLKENEIVIQGSRVKDFEPKDMISKRSNYKHCLLASIFYLYNYFEKKIKIESIVYIENKNATHFKAFQEFNFSDIPSKLKIKCEMIEYLFKKISYPIVSDMLYVLLVSQALYLKNNEFFDSYRAFNTVYTYIYKNYKGFNHSPNTNTNSDHDAIVNILKKNDLNQNLKTSVSVAGNYFSNFKEDIFNAIMVRINREKIKKDSFLSIIGFEDFDYVDSKLLEEINNIFSNIYKIEIEDYYDELSQRINIADENLKELEKIYTDPNCEEIEKIKEAKGKKENLKQMRKRVNKFKNRLHNNTKNSNPVNLIQFLMFFAQYKRNKILHGEQFESKFFIRDFNAKHLEDLSEVIIQTSVDLVNGMNANDYKF